MLRSNKKLQNYFGATWYRGVKIETDNDKDNSNDNQKMKRSMDDLLIGITEDAICFVNPITQNIVERYKMEEILKYEYRSNSFLFVAGTLMTQSKIQIATSYGGDMNRLVKTHIDLRVRDAEKK